MPYIGKQIGIGNYQVLDSLTATTTATYALTKNSVAVFPQTPANCIVSLNGVIQAPYDSYTISGSNIVFASALTASDSIDFITVLGDVLNVGTVSDGTIGIAKLSATGTKDATTFLRGDNTFAVPSANGTITNYFSAYDTSATAVSGDLILSSTFVNSGSNYSTVTGLYTAPSAGDYYFWFVYSRAGASSSTFAIEKNNSTLTGAESEIAPTTSIHMQGTIQIIATLAINDTIGITTLNNAWPDKCFFGGWKIA